MGGKILKNKVLLFDLDGTLIDSTDAICESFLFIFEKRGLSLPSIQEIKDKIGYPLEDMFSFLGVRDNIDMLVQDYRDYYRKICTQKTIMLPFAIQSLYEAFNFAKLGVVTTKTGMYSKELLDFFGILRLFDVVIGREDVKFPKPHPEPILKAIQYFDNHAQFFMIGDTLLDIQAARSANITPIAVSSGYESQERLLLSGARVFDNTLEAVLAIKDF